jgi:hypothetical protein
VITDRRPSGQRRMRRRKLHADTAYDTSPRRQAMSRRHIRIHIARTGAESIEEPGHHRWVVARTLA